MNSDDYRVQPSTSMEDIYKLNSIWPSTATLQQAEQNYLNHMARERLEHEREHLRSKSRAFRESYIKIRTNNIVLDHQSALELTKLIYAEADSITYEDIR